VPYMRYTLCDQVSQQHGALSSIMRKPRRSCCPFSGHDSNAQVRTISSEEPWLHFSSLIKIPFQPPRRRPRPMASDIAKSGNSRPFLETRDL